MKKLYNEERDTDGYDNLVMKHMMAMTAEGLHSKAAIAIELAYRDWQIEQLREALDDALRYKRADEKLVDIINGIGQQQQKPKHGRQA